MTFKVVHPGALSAIHHLEPTLQWAAWILLAWHSGLIDNEWVLYGLNGLCALRVLRACYLVADEQFVVPAGLQEDED